MNIQQIAIEIIVAVLLSLLLGKIIIPILSKESIGQHISEYGPESHLSKKGTPTMGGVIIFLTIVLSLAIFRLFSLEILIILLASLGFGLIGFWDDFLMLKEDRAEGLNPKQKLVLQVILSLAITFLLKAKMPGAFGRYIVPFSGKEVSLPGFSYFFYPFVLVATVNASNLTDGLDGLLSSVSLPIFLLLAYFSKEVALASDFALIFFGALIGFLAYNTNKASVFMGDTGSMTIGGAVAILSILTGRVFFLPIFGIIYVIEAGSVLLQVLSVKLRNGKRIFLMTPIHHGYEKKGYNEQKIVMAFTIVSLLASLVSVLI